MAEFSEMSCTHFSHGEARLPETPGLFQRHLPQVSHRVCAAGSRCSGPSVQLVLFCSTKDVPVQVWQLRGVPTAGVQRTFVSGGHHPQQAPPCSRISLYLSPAAQFLLPLCWVLFQLGTPRAASRRCGAAFSSDRGPALLPRAPLSRVLSFGADH